jgi:diguanylate cyclase (GGDEF)-like protein
VELGELATAVARDACALVEAESCSVMLLDTSRKVLSFYAAHGLTSDEVRQIRFGVGEGIAGASVAEKRAVRVEDATQDPRFAARPQPLSIRSILAVPVMVRTEAIGALSVTHSQPGRFGATEQAVLELWAQAVGMDLESALLYRLSLTDALTQVYNRRYLDELAAKWMGRAAAVFVDLDDFKRVNDQFGHEAGDRVLVETAARLMRCVRADDVVVRYGGDEFLVLLTGPSAAQADSIARRIADELRTPPIEVGGQKIAVSGSIGVVPDEQATLEELLRQVDRAMYAKKRLKSP